jgi:hypothetical protein
MAEDRIMRAIVELRKELAHIDQVIRMLETLSTGKPRRGRPPKALAEAMRFTRLSASRRR